MIKVTKDDDHKVIELGLYEYLIVEIPCDSYENNKQKKTMFNEIPNVNQIKEIFIPTNPLLVGCSGVLLHFMITSQRRILS